MHGPPLFPPSPLPPSRVLLLTLISRPRLASNCGRAPRAALEGGAAPARCSTRGLDDEMGRRCFCAPCIRVRIPPSPSFPALSAPHTPPQCATAASTARPPFGCLCAFPSLSLLSCYTIPTPLLASFLFLFPLCPVRDRGWRPSAGVSSVRLHERCRRVDTVSWRLGLAAA
ncbi:hypothetical protein B0H17DRAFT_1212493 [Mycena rosella]|uniref:Uncharacterized protein n=1 Tax=Mycena rosella TaxID=1033263 RepID=A0AAD7G673_MYCRO|nr:hypothetical protein B0H17DRAFT_1212493 [Mycena rosella]